MSQLRRVSHDFSVSYYDLEPLLVILIHHISRSTTCGLTILVKFQVERPDLYIMSTAPAEANLFWSGQKYWVWPWPDGRSGSAGLGL